MLCTQESVHCSYAALIRDVCYSIMINSEWFKVKLRLYGKLCIDKFQGKYQIAKTTYVHKFDLFCNFIVSFLLVKHTVPFLCREHMCVCAHTCVDLI